MTTNRRRGLLRQRVFWGGLASGLIVGILGTVLGLVALGPHGAAPRPAATPGDLTMTMDDALLTTGMRLSLTNVQSQLPFTVSNVAATTKAGDDIELSADGPSLIPGVLGATHLLLEVAPQVHNGALQFHILSSQLGGLTLPDFLNSLIESSMDSQFAAFGHGAITKSLAYVLVNVKTQANALIVTANVTETHTP